MLNTPVLPFTSVLVLAAREGEAATDRTELRRNGVRHVHIMQSGIEAARLLDLQSRNKEANTGRPPVELVICDEQLADISGLEFLQIVRSHPQLASLPVVLVGHSATREGVLEAIQAGCSGYVVRPYTPEAFIKRVRQAQNVRICVELPEILQSGKEALSRKCFTQAIDSFTEVIEEAKPSAEELYTTGNECLLHKDWNGAIASFSKAVRLNTLYAEAYMGLATAWRAKGDSRKYQLYLKQAGEAFTRLEQFGEARKAFLQLRSVRPDASNPLFGVGASMIKLGKFEAAAKAFVEASKLSPENELHVYIARACHFTKNPEKAVVSLCESMERIGEIEQADKLYKRLVTLSKKENMQEEPKTWLFRYPRLREIISVAKYTVDVYRGLEA